MMPYSELFEQVMLSLARAQALDSIEIVSDLYATEVDEAARGLYWLIVHPDHEAGKVPVEVMEEIKARAAALLPSAVSS